ncbi:MAG: hypothetical protein EBV53_12660, partial [Proteobacteria bacterium]|nr:hypothetical protein [Pseudomonadota bacterium]
YRVTFSRRFGEQLGYFTWGLGVSDAPGHRGPYGEALGFASGHLCRQRHRIHVITRAVHAIPLRSLRGLL